VVEQVSQILRKENSKGFTLLELMIVIAIISVLAAIALPHFARYRHQASNASAETSAKNAFVTAQAYFNDYPGGSLSSVDSLKDLGFRDTSDVTVGVSGDLDTLLITTYHSTGDKTYTVSADGDITN
jgi:prepilin-type N-terminal cleavage/methylation domain-containing protein